MAVTIYIETEEQVVLHWRHDELVRAGYPEDIASSLAFRLRPGSEFVDIELARKLRKLGCPPELAARIV